MSGPCVALKHHLLHCLVRLSMSGPLPHVRSVRSGTWNGERVAWIGLRGVNQTGLAARSETQTHPIADHPKAESYTVSLALWKIQGYMRWRQGLHSGAKGEATCPKGLHLREQSLSLVYIAHFFASPCRLLITFARSQSILCDNAACCSARGAQDSSMIILLPALV